MLLGLQPTKLFLYTVQVALGKCLTLADSLQQNQPSDPFACCLNSHYPVVPLKLDWDK